MNKGLELYCREQKKGEMREIYHETEEIVCLGSVRTECNNQSEMFYLDVMVYKNNGLCIPFLIAEAIHP